MTLTLTDSTTAALAKAVPNVPAIAPTQIVITPLDGRTGPELLIDAEWAQGSSGEEGCQRRTLTGFIPLIEEGETVRHNPEIGARVLAHMEDSLSGDLLPTPLTHGMVAGLVRELHDRLSSGEIDSIGVTGALIAASPRNEFLQKDCPALVVLGATDSPVDLPNFA